MTLASTVRCGVLGLCLLGGVSLTRAQTTVALTGGDAGEGLTLDASAVVFAYNVQGGTTTWQGVQFSPLAIGFSHPTFNTTSADPFPGESSGDDVALRGLLQSLGWNLGGGLPLSVTFSGLTPNAAYRLDVLQFSGGFASREQAIVVNGTPLTFVTISQTVAYNTAIAATSDSSGVIQLLVTQSGPYGGTGHQDGAIVNAIVLSTAIPEPSTYALGFGVVALAAGLWRRQLAAKRRTAPASVKA